MRVSEQLSILFLREKSEQTKDRKAPIYARITLNGPRKEMSLGIKVLDEHWDQAAQKANGPDSIRINKIITRAKARLQELELILSAQHDYVTAAMLKAAYKNEFKGPDTANPTPQVAEMTFCKACNYKYSKFAALVKQGLRSDTTLRRWRTTKRKIRLFLQFKFKKWDIPLSVVKFSIAEDFQHFLLTQDKLQENTAAKYLKNAREILTIAENNEWINKSPWRGVRIAYDQPERKYLSLLEIATIFKKKLIERLDHVRNIFLFACFTGFAFQEVLNLTPNDIFVGIDGKRWIRINRKKTKNPECLPLLPIPAAIVDKYLNDPYCIANNKLLPVKSYQNYNGYLKEIADICEIKFNLSTHVARHTFATTICLDHGVPLEIVSKLLGHKSIRTTQIYAQISQRNISINMQKLEQILFTKKGAKIVSGNFAELLEKAYARSIAA
ncbi:site-specific integrase [Pseudoflavitalea rhizosphaerae]|uniref:site-specific integrase n=1 Tax=Pseudoflavitalea rhizosphaerae TaxID=1884793 RepID=UPI000F8DC18D|nr:site-specific integrase [Pseudoflavitalea rhizosphaerae]